MEFSYFNFVFMWKQNESTLMRDNFIPHSYNHEQPPGQFSALSEQKKSTSIHDGTIIRDEEGSFALAIEPNCVQLLLLHNPAFETLVRALRMASRASA